MFFVVVGLCLLGQISPAQGGDSASSQASLAETARLYFSSNPEYHTGDLITTSQIEEFQEYLRKTRRKSPLSHPFLLKRALNDDAVLAQLFYSAGGARVLRSAAEDLGGYQKIEHLALHHEGRQLISRSISEHSSANIVAAIRAEEDAEKNNEVHVAKGTDRIYTVEDLLRTAFAE